MPFPRSDPAPALPGWVVLLGSGVVAAHLLALLALVLAARSGPWPTPLGGSPAEPPEFARVVNDAVTPSYLLPLRMTHQYHFPTNQPGFPGVYFEVHLKDDKGETMQTLRFPDEKANFWVQHRHRLMAQQLADDQPLPPPAGEAIAPKGQQVPKVKFWEPDPARLNMLVLTEREEHLLPRGRDVYKPSDWSLVLARSFVRHLCREHGATSGELVRHFRPVVLAGMPLVPTPPPDTYQEIVSTFGEVKP